MRKKATRRRVYATNIHPVALAILNRQAADVVLEPRIREHQALTAFLDGVADCEDHGHLSIAAHTGLQLCGRGVDPESRPIFAAACELLERMGDSPSATPTELELLRRLVAAHDRQREQIGRGDYLKALKAL